MVGSGGTDGNVVLFWLIFFLCMTLWKTIGGGNYRLTKFIMFQRFINFVKGLYLCVAAI